MKTFSETLQELLDERQLSVKDLQEYLQYADPSPIYFWLRDQKGLKLDTAVKLADYFSCSLDYLMGKREFEEKGAHFKPCPPFGEQLKRVLKEKGVSQYKLAKETEFKGGHFYKWFHQGSIPQMDTVIRLADYLGVSLDYLVGRE